MRRSPPAIFRLLLGLALGLVALLPSSNAQAYPWMIRHRYTACVACHYDPSGAGAITPYARAVAETALQMGGSAEEELPASAGFLFGAVEPPEWLALGGDVRALAMSIKPEGAPSTDRLIWMQLDASATISTSSFVASGTLGYAPEGALGAALTRGTEGNLVSRQHWLGYRFDEEGNQLLRAGRMNLPFGIRTIEHTLWARKLTRTNINDEQQYGVSAYFAGEKLRGEIMLILGNLQLRPDDYRERGFSAYVELARADSLALGLSTLVTHRDLDTIKLKETWRHVHGAFARWATPFEPLVLLTEVDYVLESSRDEYWNRGPVMYLQADLEPTQGLHFLATGEAHKIGTGKRYWAEGGWLSCAWFPLPHFDLRLDGIYQSYRTAAGRFGVSSALLQGHLYL